MSDLALPNASADLAALAPFDAQYYQVAESGSIAERLLIVARDRIYADFQRLCAPSRTDRILDLGVSDLVTNGANMMERLYPHPENLVAAGLGGGMAFRRAYPAVRYDRIAAGQTLPYADGAFPIAVSNAVLEHVGSVAEQHALVGELCRVARTVFLTVPNRFFPVEHHTAIPFAHWTRPTFRLACAMLKRTEWLQDENLILMSQRRLQHLAPTGPGYRVRVGTTGLPLGPFSSNLFMLVQRTHQAADAPA